MAQANNKQRKLQLRFFAVADTHTMDVFVSQGMSIAEARAAARRFGVSTVDVDLPDVDADIASPLPMMNMDEEEEEIPDTQPKTQPAQTEEQPVEETHAASPVRESAVSDQPPGTLDESQSSANASKDSTNTSTNSTAQATASVATVDRYDYPPELKPSLV